MLEIYSDMAIDLHFLIISQYLLKNQIFTFPLINQDSIVKLLLIILYYLLSLFITMDLQRSEADSEYTNLSIVEQHWKNQYPYNCVVRIVCEDHQGRILFVTGTLISQNVVLTSAHAFYYPSNGKVYILKTLLCKGSSKQDTRKIECFKYKEQCHELFVALARAKAAGNEDEKERLIKESAPFDYALLKLAEPIKRKHYPTLSAISQINESVMIIGYCNDKQEQPQLVKKQGVLISNKAIAQYEISTNNGMSGGPLMRIIPASHPLQESICHILSIHQSQTFDSSRNRTIRMGPLIEHMHVDIRKWEMQMNISANIIFNQPQIAPSMPLVKKQMPDYDYQLDRAKQEIRVLRERNEQLLIKLQQENKKYMKSRIEIEQKQLQLEHELKNQRKKNNEKISGQGNRMEDEMPFLGQGKYYDKGYRYQQKFMWDSAIEYYKNELLYYPEAAQKRYCIFYGLAYCLHNKNPLNQIIQNCMRALELNPEFQWTYVILNRLFWTQPKQNIRGITERLAKIIRQYGRTQKLQNMKNQLERLFQRIS